MKIAVTHDNGTVYQHFGHTKQFKIYTVEDNKVVSSETVDTGDSGHGALAGFLAARDVSIEDDRYRHNRDSRRSCWKYGRPSAGISGRQALLSAKHFLFPPRRPWRLLRRAP